MRWLSDKIRGKQEESELSSGMLYSTGLVAGGSIAGLLIAMLASVDWCWARALTAWAGTLGSQLDILEIFGERATWSALLMFAGLCVLLVRRSLRKLSI